MSNDHRLRAIHLPACEFRDDEPAHAALIEHGADHRIQIVDGTARCIASASLWWRKVPAVTGHRVGVIGHYEDSDADAARALLSTACETLRHNGCTLALGPMDGCTWRNYRFVTERGTRAPFVLEPQQPASWPRHWCDNGFTPSQQYVSSCASTRPEREAQVARARSRLAGSGVRIRPLAPSRGAAELHDIHTLSCAAFAGNPLYTPLAKAEFMRKYARLLEVLPEGLSFMAETDAGPAGFIFALPDHAPGPSLATTTVVLKTCAVLPGRRYAGLGRVLLATCLRSAREQGYTSAIHALMHTRNCSANSAKSARVIRRYALFTRLLA